MSPLAQRLVRALPALLLAALLLAEALGAAWLRGVVQTSCVLFSNNPPNAQALEPMGYPWSPSFPERRSSDADSATWPSQDSAQ